MPQKNNAMLTMTIRTTMHSAKEQVEGNDK